jgi:hypothetical protein
MVRHLGSSSHFLTGSTVKRALKASSRAFRTFRKFTDQSLGMVPEPTHRRFARGGPEVKGNRITIFDLDHKVIRSIPKNEVREMFFWPMKADKSKVDLWIWRKPGPGELSYKQEYAATFDRADIQSKTSILLNAED